MARNVSATARAAVNAPQTGEVFLTLVKIDHDDLSAPLYFVNNTENITSNSIEYFATAFSISPPAEEDGVIRNTSIAIDGVDRSVVQAIRSISGNPPTITMSIILASTPDVVEAGPWEFTLTNVHYNAYTVSGDLIYQNYVRDNLSMIKYSANNFPGLYF